MYRSGRISGAPFFCVIKDLTVSGDMGGKEAVYKLLGEDPAVKGNVVLGELFLGSDCGAPCEQPCGFHSRLARPFHCRENSRSLPG
jgi:hypothetical protein